MNESIKELLKSAEREIKSSEEYVSEENKAYRDERVKEGVKAQKEIPQEEKKAAKQRQVQTRQRTHAPER